MVETAIDQVGATGSGGARGEFDVSAVKEAKSLSATGLVIGGAIAAVLLFIGMNAEPPQEAAVEEPMAAEDAIAAEEPMTAEEAAAEEAAEAAENTADEMQAPAPLGDYMVINPGAAPLLISFSGDGTFVIGDSTIRGKWSYDSNGILCFSFLESRPDCIVKLFGSDEKSTWRNVDDENRQFVLEKVVYDAAEDQPAE